VADCWFVVPRNQYLLNYIDNAFKEGSGIAPLLVKVGQYSKAQSNWNCLLHMEDADNILPTLGRYIHRASQKTEHKIPMALSLLIMSRNTSVSFETSAHNVILR
jgi:hypothetical protein